MTDEETRDVFGMSVGCPLLYIEIIPTAPILSTHKNDMLIVSGFQSRFDYTARTEQKVVMQYAEKIRTVPTGRVYSDSLGQMISMQGKGILDKATFEARLTLRTW